MPQNRTELTRVIPENTCIVRAIAIDLQFKLFTRF